MVKKKILFITQGLAPYIAETPMATASRDLPLGIQERGFEIRTFMPRWGYINERRNQLHEVQRLTGMNIIIDDTDNPLIVKVATMPAPAKMQVYFIDNDDFFKNKQMFADEEGKEYDDNALRSIFYTRGVLKTVKEVKWKPDLIHCMGWMSAPAALYLKTVLADDVAFEHTKLVFSAHDEEGFTIMPQNLERSLMVKGITAKALKATKIDFTQPEALPQLALHYADGFIDACTTTSPLMSLAQEKGLPTLTAQSLKENVDAYADFYRQILGE